MKKVLLGSAMLVIVAAAAVLSHHEPERSADLQVKSAERNPWTHLKINHDSSDFRFAILGDRTGGARDGVFEKAIDELGLLQPEFVLTVGDVVQGFTEDKDEIDEQWKEADRMLAKLPCPFFFLPGNHDFSNKEMQDKWKERFGRSYYHFVYKGVLFLMMLADDIPSDRYGRLGKEQLAYFRQVLDDNKDARWSVILMHKPLWLAPDIEATGLLDLEKALGNRNYTVFCGHRHWFLRTERNGRDYYMLATTGGMSRLRGNSAGEFDHICWVTMKKDGPVVANLLLDGILPGNIKTARPGDPPKEKKP